MNEQMNEWVGVLHTVTLTQPSAAGPNCRGGRAPPSTPEQGSAENSHHWDEGAEGRAGGTHAVTTPWPARPAPSDRSGSGGTESCPPAPCTRPSTCTVEADERTHDAVLHAEAQLVYLRSGRLMRTVVTGGQLTMFSFTCVWFFRPCGAGTGGPVGLRCRWEDNLRGLGG